MIKAKSKKLKKLTRGEGVDIAIEATGVSSVLDQAFNSTRKGGKILVEGIHDRPFSLNTLALSYREISLIGTFAHQYSESEHLSLIAASNKIKLKELISHYFHIDEIKTAYEMFLSRKTNKVILTF